MGGPTPAAPTLTALHLPTEVTAGQGLAVALATGLAVLLGVHFAVQAPSGGDALTLVMPTLVGIAIVVVGIALMSAITDDS